MWPKAGDELHAIRHFILFYFFLNNQTLIMTNDFNFSPAPALVAWWLTPNTITYTGDDLDSFIFDRV